MDSDIKQLRPNPAPAAKITSHTKGPQSTTGHGGQSRAAETTSAPASDTVTVTDQAARLQQLEQSLANTPVVDSARVAQLREAIASGGYQPDPQRIADKLSQLERDLL